MLRIAVPNKGSLAEPAAQLLGEAGYATRRDGRELVLADPDNDAEFFFLRPRDIALYVGSGTLDVGITGRDLLLDSRAAAAEVLPLSFAGSTFRFAAHPGTAAGAADLQGVRVATSYPGLVEDHLRAAGVVADVVRLDGAVETAVRLGVADVIADVVETGSTLRAAGLEVFGEPILRSEAVLVRRRDAPEPDGLGVLVRRVQGVLVARQYVMVDYDVRREHAEAACAITPGLESPTVSPLADPDWVAVRAMVPRAGTNRVMDELYDLGARAILVTTIHACRI
ncbi:ATP phosphoribosyltransferase [Quadrisphaera sp. DSM 44207]|uniref:ATP phosphoribosyltransferase n=1 Tax=Quadrisphaera sp. DSM 44207 TaxID=1881057 RepID=UPI000888331D|nr:ATP phosphoribosyltransferase [Quadrisphaera sp. DSM 44207]SDQ45751.1 ATP phosphoribosyltransferase (homohexameric) [Quadrisphaera sp. DSM 44207]